MGVVDIRLLQSIATQMMKGSSVKVQGKTLRVGRTSVQHLKTVTFNINGREHQAIEQTG